MWVKIANYHNAQAPHSLLASTISWLQGVCRCSHFLAHSQDAKVGSRFNALLSGRPWYFAGDVGDLARHVMFSCYVCWYVISLESIQMMLVEFAYIFGVSFYLWHMWGGSKLWNWSVGLKLLWLGSAFIGIACLSSLLYGRSLIAILKVFGGELPFLGFAVKSQYFLSMLFRPRSKKTILICSTTLLSSWRLRERSWTWIASIVCVYFNLNFGRLSSRF